MSVNFLAPLKQQRECTLQFPASLSVLHPHEILSEAVI